MIDKEGELLLVQGQLQPLKSWHLSKNAKTTLDPREERPGLFLVFPDVLGPALA